MAEGGTCRLARYLDELTEHELKKFKLTVREAGPPGWLPWGRMEPADRPDLAALLVSHLGAAGAWRAALSALDTLGLRQLRERAAKEPPPPDAAEAGGPDCAAPREEASGPEGEPGHREKYRERVRRRFQALEERNARLGEWVPLSRRYTPLLLRSGHAGAGRREQELRASGGLHGRLREERGRPLELAELFDADAGEGGGAPTTVVLLGVAGIGKTTLARKVLLDWASGALYPGRFHYALYVRCGALDGAAPRSVAELLADWLEGTAPGSGPAPVATLLARPARLLFVLDGFDELLGGRGGPGGRAAGAGRPACEHLRELLAKRLLPEASLLVTTRPLALEPLQALLEQPRVAEVLGFGVAQREAYFHKYFPEPGQAGRAWAAVQANEVLFTMCFVPLVCWVLCTGLRQQLDSGEAPAPTARTATAVYTAFVGSLLRPGPARSPAAGLRGLCALAAAGLRQGRLWFREPELRRHGLDAATVSAFLHVEQLQREAEREATYSFFHATFQEFFAALALLLERRPPWPLGRAPLGRLLRGSEAPPPLAVRFLFGLSSPERAGALERLLGGPVARGSRRALLRWVRAQAARRPGRARTLGLLYCLFEAQEPEFVRSAMASFREVRVRVRTRMDGLVVAFCLRGGPSPGALELDGLGCGAAGLGLPGAGTCSLDDVCREISSGLWVRRSLSELGLGEDALGDAGMRWLCRALEQPGWPLHSLTLLNCWLTSEFAASLSCALALGGGRSLTRLDLSYNPLEDPGAASLCRALQQRGCGLRSLCLKKCHLTEEACEGLGSVLAGSRSLQWLDLSFNVLGDRGVGLLCAGLRQAGCPLRTLRLRNCSLTGRSCPELAAVLSSGSRLLDLRLRNNALGDAGLGLLCRGLGAPRCRLRKLELANCRLGPACGPCISSVLGAPSSLQFLCLSGNALGDAGVRELCEGLRRPGCALRELKVQMCGLTGRDFEALARVLSDCPGLRLLDLSDSSPGEEGARWLCWGLKQPGCRLRSLRLFRSGLSEAAKTELAAVARAKHGLEISYQSSACIGLQGLEP
ncbi:NACHT, LRR and PYD domains-containing protein 3-like isoform X2 [Monodelphis domestica]|uniref:NACHT, LRR and PYD domains-containing protein 3-like isoform X2 n=1 Tax=Monodelphis domestica TaxID=13616 RepID=UPI0024E1AB8F|nr:NACHT, LRR and PYD domains-containing protein 3-like isoform X2 [Monodelphis domestica]